MTMTGPELRRWRIAAGLTQRQAAAWYGLPEKSGERTWRRYETGERRVPAPLAKRIRDFTPRKRNGGTPNGPRDHRRR